MKNIGLFFAIYIFWMACLPCTDQILEKHEHLPNVADTAHTTGSSPFHENTCPVLCVCGCCASFTVALKYEFLVFRKPVAPPKAQPLFFNIPAEKHFTYPIWRPPQHSA